MDVVSAGFDVPGTPVRFRGLLSRLGTCYPAPKRRQPLSDFCYHTLGLQPSSCFAGGKRVKMRVNISKRRITGISVQITSKREISALG